jgi:TorA maturation chaperone TorD
MKLSTAVVAGAALYAGVGAFLGASGAGVTLAPPSGGVALAQDTYSEDQAITRAFRSVLNRDPSDRELRRYRVLMEDNGWREADIRRDLTSRTDYQRYSTNRRGMQPEGIVRRAYQDILGRNPDAEGMRTYRSKIIDQGWTEADVRDALRRSDEYAGGGAGGFRTSSADRIIRRAYQDILGREPDAAGLATYRRNIVERGWDEQDVRNALRQSAERRVTGGRPADSGLSGGGLSGGAARSATLSDAQAADIVRRAYQSILNREPDEGGLNDYKARILRDGWTEADVAKALRNSPEYRSKH